MAHKEPRFSPDFAEEKCPENIRGVEFPFSVVISDSSRLFRESPPQQISDRISESRTAGVPDSEIRREGGVRIPEILTQVLRSKGYAAGAAACTFAARSALSREPAVQRRWHVHFNAFPDELSNMNEQFSCEPVVRYYEGSSLLRESLVSDDTRWQVDIKSENEDLTATFTLANGTISNCAVGLKYDFPN